MKVPADPQWERRVRESFAQQSFMRLIGAEIAALAPGRCTLSLPFRADLCQQNGFLHAGVTSAIADSAAGYAAFSLMPAGAAVLTVEFKINLMAPAAGERFLARGLVIRAGRALTTTECDVVAIADGEEKMVARMLATMMGLQGSPEKTKA